VTDVQRRGHLATISRRGYRAHVIYDRRMIPVWLLFFTLQTSPTEAGAAGAVPADARAAIARANDD